MARCTGSPTGPTRRSPNGRIGVYTVWGGDELIYVGMGGRAAGPNADTNGPASTKLTGLRSRLASHASGRRSGDQFCIYVFDRLVLPTLGRQQIQNAARGQLSLDGLTRQLIRQSLCYRFTLVGQQLMTAANTAAKPLDNARPGLTAVECRPSARTALDDSGRPAHSYGSVSQRVTRPTVARQPRTRVTN